MPAMRPPWVLVALLAAGCAAPYGERQQAWRHDAAQGRTAAAVAQIDDTYGPDDAAAGGDALLRRMELGAVAGIGGDAAAAIPHLDVAARLGEERRDADAVREIGTFLLNDTLRPYAGWPHEHALVETLRTLAHLERAQAAAGLTGAAPDPDEAHRQYERAVNTGRRLSLTLPGWVKGLEDEAYPDDPFARLLGAAAVFALPPDQRLPSDEQAADAALRGAVAGYKAMAGAPLATVRWAPAERPASLVPLWLRAAEAGEGAAERARTHAVDPALGQVPAGHGTLLVLDLAGYVPRMEELRFTMVAAQGTNGKDVTGRTYRIGGVLFGVTGPGADCIDTWGALPLPGELVRQLSPGGLSVFGFGVPVYADPRGRSAPALARLDGPGGGRDLALEPLADPEALARGLLRRRQPGIVVKTLARTVAKQVAVGAVTHAIGKDGSNEAQLLALGVGFVGSLIATASEQADVRSWVTLPSRIDGALADLPAGTWTVSVPGAAPRNVTIPAGRLVVVPVRTFRDPVPPPAAR
ncbi:MAG: hypothetical protein RLZZ127_2510 [Planctomycetota bacterium]|jgi:hypothetical protein